MPVIKTGLNRINEIHTSDRLEVNLTSAEEDVQKMKLRVWFNVENRLPNGEIIGKPYWDNQQVLEISCEDDTELADAMRIIQRKIGEARYKQITTPPEVPEPVENPEIMPPIEDK